MCNFISLYLHGSRRHVLISGCLTRFFKTAPNNHLLASASLVLVVMIKCLLHTIPKVIVGNELNNFISLYLPSPWVSNWGISHTAVRTDIINQYNVLPNNSMSCHGSVKLTCIYVAGNGQMRVANCTIKEQHLG